MMDLELKQEIINHYKDEYWERLINQKKGLMGKIVRKIDNLKDRPNGHEAVVTSILAISILAGVVTSAIIPLSGAGIWAFGAAFFATAFSIASSNNKLAKERNSIINRDLNSGELAIRYKTEVLDKKLNNSYQLEQKELGSIKEKFNSARELLEGKLKQITSSSPSSVAKLKSKY